MGPGRISTYGDSLDRIVPLAGVRCVLMLFAPGPGIPEHLVATAKEPYLSEVSDICRVMERMYASPP